jgi:hypothetical protein
MQGAMENLGYRAQIMPTATRADLLTGREVADIGQCCPTSFTTGNLVNVLRREAQRIGAEEVAKNFVYLTAGSCGACRFGQYHQSHELALRNAGMRAFRMFLVGQEGLDQGAASGGGLDLNLPFTLGAAWAVVLADVVQDLEYQGGTHRNLAVVKAQVDFIRAKVRDAEIVVHPYSGEAGAIGAALCAADSLKPGDSTRFRGYDVIDSLEYTSTTNEHTTCTWCPVSCKRTFIDVRLPHGMGRAWSKVPLGVGWERVISGNSCPKGLLDDVHEMRVVKKNLEVVRDAHPNTAELVREGARLVNR